jgi:hypothetical protein
MEKPSFPSCGCGDGQPGSCCGSPPLEPGPVPTIGAAPELIKGDVPCCGEPAGASAGIYEKPGYGLCGYVKGFIETPAGAVPCIKTRLAWADHLGRLRVRLGIGRNTYKVVPGLYALGRPDANAPVLVTANYKLSFDHLRSQLEGIDAWLLVLDTRGINVWCAAGKGTFGTDEVVARVKRTHLDQVVQHRRLILPQLSASGVAAQHVKRQCGFEVVWGPVRASDVRAFLSAGCKAEARMRRVTFSMTERMVLVPVELALTRKALAWALPAIFLLSGVGPHFFSITAAWQRGLAAVSASAAGILSGCVIVPLLLPWIPGRAFAVKGALTGSMLGLVAITFLGAAAHSPWMAAAALIALTTALSSYLAMNFTGTTPFTSPTGVEKEMKRAIPLQLAAVLIAVGLWIGAAF